ncbi:MAG TPA: hypothetical protein VN698_07165 [Bacteroidia bacterium]|nr:hypothetical protein [Bacteroidia bacterium]
MEVLFHFIFELIKISMLGCIYATLILLTFKIISRFQPDSWFDRVSKKKLRLWFLSGLFISTGLFFNMFSYWGDHGLGDSARVPIGHSRSIQQIDGTTGYIQDEGPVRMLSMDKFIVTDDFIYGSVDSQNENYDGKYFIYDLVNNKVQTFNQEKYFIRYLTILNLNTKPDYKDFDYYYAEHWHGWRFFLLA